MEYETCMPRGDKSSYTSKQKRKAEHIEKGYEKRGVSKKESEKRAWATVNKKDKGAKKKKSTATRKRSKKTTGSSKTRRTKKK
jgi:hypothetical protein